jgi:hypothetical protein
VAGLGAALWAVLAWGEAPPAAPPEQPADAPEAGGFSAGPSKPAPTFQSTVHASPLYTQDRVFAGSRYWLLDTGKYEVEVWVDDKFQPDHTNEGLLQMEIELGIAPHLQLDIYQNFNFGTDGFSNQGQQIELRIAFGSYYNQIPLNPVLYLEWAPHHNAQDRAEIRLLVGGDLGVGGRFLWAANLFAECNIDDFQASYSEGLDAEGGVTAAASYAVVQDWIRVGAEGRGGFDMHGKPQLYPSLMLGPNVLFTIRPAHLKLTATALIGLMPEDPRVRLLVIAGYGF